MKIDGKGNRLLLNFLKEVIKENVPELILACFVYLQRLSQYLKFRYWYLIRIPVSEKSRITSYLSFIVRFTVNLF